MKGKKDMNDPYERDNPKSATWADDLEDRADAREVGP